MTFAAIRQAGVHRYLLPIAFTMGTVACDAPNKPPAGNIDVPGQDGTVTSPLKVIGWAGDDRGIRQVRVLVDGRVVAVVGLTLDRPDVSAALPRFRHGSDRHGWEATVELAPGPHRLSVQAEDTDLFMQELAARNVVVVAK